MLQQADLRARGGKARPACWRERSPGWSASTPSATMRYSGVRQFRPLPHLSGHAPPGPTGANFPCGHIRRGAPRKPAAAPTHDGEGVPQVRFGAHCCLPRVPRLGNREPRTGNSEPANGKPTPLARSPFPVPRCRFFIVLSDVARRCRFPNLPYRRASTRRPTASIRSKSICIGTPSPIVYKSNRSS